LRKQWEKMRWLMVRGLGQVHVFLHCMAFNIRLRFFFGYLITPFSLLGILAVSEEWSTLLETFWSSDTTLIIWDVRSPLFNVLCVNIERNSVGWS
jgi:hypothetical protein